MKDNIRRNIITCTPGPDFDAGDGRRERCGRRWWTPPSLPSVINRPVDLLIVLMVLFDYYANSNRHDNLVAELIDVTGGPWVPWMRSTGRPQRGNPPLQPRGPMRSEPRCSTLVGPMGPRPQQYPLLLYNLCTTLIFLPLDYLHVDKFFHNHDYNYTVDDDDDVDADDTL